MTMNYQEALQGLRGISPSLAKNPSYDPLRPKRRNAKPLSRIPSSNLITQWVQRPIDVWGHTRLTPTQQEDLRRLNVIHVAGTKGKGSTCRFISAFLEAHHERRGVPVKICTLTGPHLLSCTERIQINGTPITQEAFAESFSQVVEAVNRPSVRRDGPRMTQLVALIAINYAVRHGVDFFVCEAFCGGLFDATNVFDSPAITAITKLGMDHVHLLGPSLAEIARNKAGIMREHTICVTCEQPPEAFEVLMEHSNRLSAPLDDVTEDDPPSEAIAALPTVAHRTNAAIALKVVTHLLLQRYSPDHNLRVLDEQDVILGLQWYKSPGSFREIARPPCHFFLDTAHNTLSLPVALEWFSDKVALNENKNASRGFRVLIYSHSAKLEGKESFDLVLDSLRGDRQVDLLIISSLVGRADGTSAAERLTMKAETDFGSLEELKSLAVSKGWLSESVKVAQSVEQALETAEQAYKRQSKDSSHMSCFLTGSSYLVAEALALLEVSET